MEEKIRKEFEKTFFRITTGEETTLSFSGVFMCIIIGLFLPFELIRNKILERKLRKQAQKEELEQYQKYIKAKEWKTQHDL